MNTDALRQAAYYCAYQERTIQEVRKKLQGWDVSEEDTEEILSRLVTEGYLSEERYARSFVGGKFRVKHWGKLKIEQELRRKGLSAENRQAGLEEINEKEYLETLKILLTKKAAALKDEDPRVRKQKLMRYALSKGYESSMIWKLLGEDWE
ncbi:MAG: regulatory protein RecX [Siphonobacter sp.]